MDLKQIRLKEVMKSPVITASIDDPFSKVEEKFRMKGIRHLPVVDAANRVVGLVTQRDLYRIASPRITDDGYVYEPGFLNNFILRYVMTRDPATLYADDRLATAIEMMARQKYGCIPVVDSQGKIAGIVTETDILKIVARSLS